MPAVEPDARACPACGERGVAVRLQTVKALLTEIALRRIRPAQYRFCDSRGCEVVYFGDASDRFGTDEVRVTVWQKHPPGGRVLCYCFGESEAVIRAERVDGRRADVIDRIRQHVAAERCACDIRNPRGACCLGDVIAAVKRIDAEIVEGRTNDGVLTDVPHR